MAKMRKIKGKWGENLPVSYAESQRQRQAEIDAEKEAQNRTYERENQLKRQQASAEKKQLNEAQKQVSADESERQRILAINRKADARLQIQRLDEQEKQRKQVEKELIKKQKAQAKIDKVGGTEYVTAKLGHLKIKRKKEMRKWKLEKKFNKRPLFIQNITKRKKGKRGTSDVGNVLHSMLYPVQPRRHKRW